MEGKRERVMEGKRERVEGKRERVWRVRGRECGG